MLGLDNDMLMHLFAIVAGCASVYGGIRADIKNIHERVKDTHNGMRRAHERLDHHLQWHKQIEVE